ncbi:MAG: restriction endonuclease subunit S [Opitutales bacterium]
MGGEWRTARFEDLLLEPVRNGIYKKKEFHGRGAKIVNMGELFRYPRLSDVEMKRVELTEKEVPTVLLQSGDLLFARRSLTAEGAGKCSIVREVNEATTFESSIIRARPNPELADSDFLYYFYSSEIGYNLLDSIRRSVAVSGITGGDLKNLELTIPPLPEQKAIAHILGTLDDKIELNRRMNATLEGMAQALFKSWFVDFDPVIDNALAAGNPIPDELTPRAEVRKKALANGTTQQGSVDRPTPSDPKSLFPAAFEFTEELGWIPEGWEVNEFGHLAQNVREGVDPTTLPAQTPYVGLEHIDKQGLSLSRWGTAAEVDSQKSHFKPDDFLFGKLRPYFHKVCHVISEGICSTDILVIRPHREDDAGYVGCQIFEPEFVEYANLRSTGTRMPRASWKDMAQYEVACPPENLRKAFNDLIKPTREKCAGAVIANQNLGKLRDTLLPELISGDLRLSDANELIEEVAG